MLSVVISVAVGVGHACIVGYVAQLSGYDPTLRESSWWIRLGTLVGTVAIASIPTYLYTSYGTVVPVVGVVALLLASSATERTASPGETLAAVYIVLWPAVIVGALVLFGIEVAVTSLL